MTKTDIQKYDGIPLISVLFISFSLSRNTNTNHNSFVMNDPNNIRITKNAITNETLSQTNIYVIKNKKKMVFTKKYVRNKKKMQKN